MAWEVGEAEAGKGAGKFWVYMMNAEEIAP